jgi:fucose permease
MYAAFGLLGLGLSGIFPTLLSMAGENNPGIAGTAMGFIIAIGNIGGVFIPWAIAWISESVGMGSAMYLYLLDITLLIACAGGYVILSSRMKRA